MAEATTAPSIADLKTNEVVALMAYQFCTVQDEGRLRIVTLNRPEVLNALHADANDELAAVWDEFAARDDLWVGIITGAGERGVLRRQRPEGAGRRQAPAERPARFRRASAAVSISTSR